MPTETNTAPNTSHKLNGHGKGKQPRVITNPGDVADWNEARAAGQGWPDCGFAGLVMMQIDAVNSKKDDLTIAIKGLADTAKQLVRAYARQQAAIEKLGKRVKELEK